MEAYSTTDLLRSTEQERQLDDCLYKLEKAMADVDAQDLKTEVIGAVKSLLPYISSQLEMLDYIHQENILDISPNSSITLRLLFTIPV